MSAVMQQPANLEVVLSRLDAVQRSGKGYRAKCPSCGGQSRKLSVSDADDGRVLLHCFGGCEPASVIAAVGLSLGDLFPVRLRPETPDERRAWRRAAKEAQWIAALDVLDFEVVVVQLAGNHLAGGKPLHPEDAQRLQQAIQRIGEAKAVLRAR